MTLTMNLPHSVFRRLSVPLLLLVMSLFASLVQAKGQLTATVDRAQISIDQTLKLQVRYNEQVMFGEPDFSALQQNFDILGRARSHQYHNINGRTESWTQWTLTLAPLREGQLLIPSFEYENSFSDAIEITVSEAPPATATDQPVYLETELNKTSGHVQEQFLYTIRLLTSVDLSGLDRAEPKIRNALMKTVAEHQYQRVINGVPYGVVETTYAIFPQQSGTLEIPPTIWSVGISSGRGFRYDPFLSQGGEQLRLRTDAKTIQVTPKPASFTGDHWLPARKVTLEQRWSQSPDEFVLGEPITRTLTVRAQGLMASQLPPLDVRETSGVKYYPDQPQAEESVARDGVTTIKTESYAIVPSRTGKITLPAITLRWWDTEAGRQQEATLPAHTITVLPAAATASPTTSAPAAEATAAAEGERTEERTEDKIDSPAVQIEAAGPLPSSLWPYAVAVLLLTNLLTLTLWLRAQRNRQPVAPAAPTAPPAMSEKQAYKALQQDLNRGDASAIRAALLTWGRLYERDPHLASLQQLATALPPLAASISQLEAALYGQSGTMFDASGLAQAVQELRRHGYSATASDGSSSLPPLYASEPQAGGR